MTWRRKAARKTACALYWLAEQAATLSAGLLRAGIYFEVRGDVERKVVNYADKRKSEAA